MMLCTHQIFPHTDDCQRNVNARGRLGVDSDILNLANRWRKVVNFTPLVFYFSRKYTELLVHWMLGGSACRGETSPVTVRI